jgi:ribose transport system substrate-binding protein
MVGRRTGGLRAWRVTAGISTLALGLAACGSPSEQAGSAGDNRDGASNEGIVNECEEMLEEGRQPLEWTAPGPEIDASSLDGERIMFLSLAQAVPAIAQVATATQEAGELVGIDVEVYDTQGNVTRMQQGIQQAIDTEVAAIILLGIPLDATAAALEKAKAAGITIVSELNNQPTAGEPGQGAGPNVFGSTGPDRTYSGQLMACKAVADTGGEAKAVIFGVDELTTAAPPQVAGMEEILDQCSGCSYTKNSTSVAAWQTDLPSKASSVVQADPEVNYLLPLYDGMAIFMASGVRQAGAGDRVKIVSFNAVPAALSMIKSGSPLVADPGNPNTWMAWQGLDQAMRGMLGVDPGDPVVPIRFFDEKNLEGLDVDDEDELFGNPAYRDGFKELWGVSG